MLTILLCGNKGANVDDTFAISYYVRKSYFIARIVFVFGYCVFHFLIVDIDVYGDVVRGNWQALWFGHLEPPEPAITRDGAAQNLYHEFAFAFEFVPFKLISLENPPIFLLIIHGAVDLPIKFINSIRRSVHCCLIFIGA